MTDEEKKKQEELEVPAEKPQDTPPVEEVPKKEDVPPAKEEAQPAETPPPVRAEPTNGGTDESLDSKEELIMARAQLAAIKNGMDAAVVEDAVYLALRDVRKDGGVADEPSVDKALKGVLKRHPEWGAKSKNEGAGGFKIGAPGEQKPISNDAIAQAFGNKKGN